MAKPEAAMALARPVGFVEGRFHGRLVGFFPFCGVITDLTDVASRSRDPARNVFPFLTARPGFSREPTGNSGIVIDVGDSTMALLEASSAFWLSLAFPRLRSGVVAAREWVVDMGSGGGTSLRDLLDDFRCISGVNGVANVPPAGKGGAVEVVFFVKASRRLDFEDEAVFEREGGRDWEGGTVFDDEVATSATVGSTGSSNGRFEGDEGVR